MAVCVFQGRTLEDAMSAAVTISRLTADPRPTSIGLASALGLAALIIILSIAFERTIVRVRPFVISAVQSNFDLKKAYAVSAMSEGRHGSVVRGITDVSQATRFVATQAVAEAEHVGSVDGTRTDGSINATSLGVDDVETNERPATQQEEVLDEDFTAVEREPTFELADLYRLIRYPEQARRLGLEGSVVVKALVTPEGTVERVSIYETDNVLFNIEALNGVRQLRMTPARQNSQAVTCWVYIPVKFALR